MITTVLLDDILYEKLRKYCYDNKFSLSKAMRIAVKRFLDETEKNKS